MKNVTLWMGTTKGELIKAAYDNNPVKLGNVDVALPIEELNRLRAENKNSYWFVYDYNGSPLGTLRNLNDVATENGINFIYR